MKQFLARNPARLVFDVGPYPTLEDAIREAPEEMQLLPGSTYEVGESVAYVPNVDGLAVISRIALDARQKLTPRQKGLVDTVEEDYPTLYKWLSDVLGMLAETEAIGELNKALTTFVAGWLHQHGLYPRFGTVENVTEHTVPLPTVNIADVKPADEPCRLHEAAPPPWKEEPWPPMAPNPRNKPVAITIEQDCTFTINGTTYALVTEVTDPATQILISKDASETKRNIENKLGAHVELFAWPQADSLPPNQQEETYYFVAEPKVGDTEVVVDKVWTFVTEVTEPTHQIKIGANLTETFENFKAATGINADLIAF